MKQRLCLPFERIGVFKSKFPYASEHLTGDHVIGERSYRKLPEVILHHDKSFKPNGF